MQFYADIWLIPPLLLLPPCTYLELSVSSLTVFDQLSFSTLAALDCISEEAEGNKDLPGLE